MAAWLEKRVSVGRYLHSLGVREAVTGLAQKYGVDPRPLRLAALFHDCMRELSGPELLALAAKWSVKVRDVDRQAPVLLHARLAAELARREFRLADPRMVSAIEYHTTGNRGMSLSDKLFFIADHIEPGRDHPLVLKLRLAAYEDVDRAVLESIRMSERHLRSAGAVIDPETIRLKQHLQENMGGAGSGNGA
ncbi:MAG: bis(5'-nucleosyl)-tetraphosphatase (symmetrical) YqeK [Thermoleophilia bacterium]|nr:bis(5'-nucleosyl)-tetraphosphatase (symmetrical) YqeK [Thermoleophilia bacterium]